MEIEFTYEGKPVIIKSNIYNTIGQAYKKFCLKTDANIKELCFIYNGKKVLDDICFIKEVANSEDIKRNKMNILVYKIPQSNINNHMNTSNVNTNKYSIVGNNSNINKNQYSINLTASNGTNNNNININNNQQIKQIPSLSYSQRISTNGQTTFKNFENFNKKNQNGKGKQNFI